MSERPPPRMWYALVSTLIGGFAALMSGSFVQAMSKGESLHLYSYLWALSMSVGGALAAAKLAWPKEVSQ